MQPKSTALLIVLLAAACSDGSDNNASGPVSPPLPPTEPPQSTSFSQFTRDVFNSDANSEPRAVNGVDFAQDAENDTFSDLLR